MDRHLETLRVSMAETRAEYFGGTIDFSARVVRGVSENLVARVAGAKANMRC